MLNKKVKSVLIALGVRYIYLKILPSFNKFRSRVLLPVTEHLDLYDCQMAFVGSVDLGLLSIDPLKIDLCFKKGPVNMKGMFLYGDCDISDTLPIAEVRPSIASTIEDLFVRGNDYECTEQFQVMTDAVNRYLVGEIENPAPYGGYWCKSHDDIKEYFARLNRCYTSMLKNGYKSQAELIAEAGDSLSLNDEIRIYIGRDGEPILGYGGTHRTIMAKMIGLDKVCVKIDGIHRDFLNDKLFKTTTARQEILNALSDIGLVQYCSGRNLSIRSS